ncbi:DUSAM domain-containing protein [Archangium lansingense]|uniref:DUSAM domain-containing protein n=1 Tax=Archangium lansingense TaxID=2995310 RepID=UPI003B7EEEB9
MELHDRIQRGEPVTFDSEEVRTLVRRVALDVAIRTEVSEQELRDPTRAASLVREIRQRIREGSRRLGSALLEVYRLQESGDLKGARKVLEDLLAVEVVPLYRHTAQSELDDLLAYTADNG